MAHADLRRTLFGMANPELTLPRGLTEHLNESLDAAVNRHYAAAKDWMPHEYVPWANGRNFDTDPYVAAESPLPLPVQTALQLNLLTEENLPSYHRELTRALGTNGTWGDWIARWTAEEGRHGIVLRDYLVVQRIVDPEMLEIERMATVQAGYHAPEKGMLEGLAYVSFQELATRISHRNTGHVSNDPLLDRLLQRIAADENLHHIFYRSIIKDALDYAPTATLEAIAFEAENFQMPGTGMPGFMRKAAIVARADIYNVRIHRDEVLAPLLRYWRIFELEGLDAAGELARTRIQAVIAGLDAAVEKLESRRAS